MNDRNPGPNPVDFPSIDTRSPVPEFSIIKGGPAYKLLVWTGVVDREMAHPLRMILIIALLGWVPLAILSLVEGRAFEGVAIPFFFDVENQVRCLIAIPLLLWADTAVQGITTPRIKQFVERNIIRESSMADFRSITESANRRRDSVLGEVTALVLVYTFGAWFHGTQFASASSAVSAWYASPDGVSWNLTLAGYWMTLVTLPVFQFLLARWYLRMFNWFVFLWQVSKLDLNLLPTHSDLSAGLGFLIRCAYAFGYVLLAQSSLLAGYIAGQGMYSGQDVRSLTLQAVAVALFLMATVLLPLCVFAPKLVESKCQGLDTYGKLASRYVEKFDGKWILGPDSESEKVLGTEDIQSLAALGDSIAFMEHMRFVPFGIWDIAFFAILLTAPLLPLALFVFSLEELLEILMRIFI